MISNVRERYIASIRCHVTFLPNLRQSIFSNHLREARLWQLPHLETEEAIRKRWSVSPAPGDPPPGLIATRRRQLQREKFLFTLDNCEFDNASDVCQKPVCRYHSASAA